MIERTNEEICEFFGINEDDNYYFNIAKFDTPENQLITIYNRNLYSGPTILILGHMNILKHMLTKMILDDNSET